jgi:hypothetical protein
MRVSVETAKQQFKLFEICENKSFWIWNIEERKRADIRTNGGCCLITLLNYLKEMDKINFLYEYERIILIL